MGLPRYRLHKYKISGIPIESYRIEDNKPRWRMSPTYVVILHILAAITVINFVMRQVPLVKAFLDQWWASIAKG